MIYQQGNLLTMAKKKPAKDNLLMQRLMMGGAALLVAALIAWFFTSGSGTMEIEGQNIRDASKEVPDGGPTGLPGQPRTPDQSPPSSAPQVPADQIPGMGR